MRYLAVLLLLICCGSVNAQKYVYGGEKSAKRRDSSMVVVEGKLLDKTGTGDIKYAKDSILLTTQDSVAAVIDSIAEISATEKLYMEQTAEERYAKTDKGAAVFFNMPLNSGKDFYYGFFDNAPKGTILKVHNPGTEMVIFVKVLGGLPKTKLYYNSILGISDRAKEALGVVEDKMWCEVSYASGW